jgi:hypothetical protein
MAAAERASAPGMTLLYLWRYPPVFALLCAPLALLPYLAAWAVWTGATFAAFAAALRRILPGREGLLLALGAPASFVCVLHGQTGFAVAAVCAWGLVLLDRRPLLAGGVLSLLACKPHFAVLVPLLLLVGGRWRALAALAGGTLLLALASLAAFGLPPWIAFLRGLPDMAATLTQGGLSWAKVPSPFVGALSLGAPVWAGWSAQGIVGAAASLAAAGAWRRADADPAGRAAATLAALLLISPYLFDYDLVLVSVAAAFALASRAARRPGVPSALALALAAPALAPPLYALTHLQVGAVATVALLAALAAGYGADGEARVESGAGSAASTRLTTRWVG